MSQQKNPTGDQAADPFSLENLKVDGTTMEDLGIERPVLIVPVSKPGRQEFVRTHPSEEFQMAARVLELEAERESYLVTRQVWPHLPGETKSVHLRTYITRHGNLGLWPLKMADPDSGRDNSWNISARKAAEIAETKWVRVQANMGLKGYDVATSTHIPDPQWPEISFQEILRIAFGDGRLIDTMDHPVVKQLFGE